MNLQLELFAERLAHRDPRLDRLLFMVFVERAAALQAARIGQTHDADRRMRATPLKLDRLHVSLLTVHTMENLPDGAAFPEAIVQYGRAIGDRVRAGPFRATFDQAASFANMRKKKPYVLLGDDDGVEGFRAVLAQILQAMNGAPEGDAAGFKPHVTMSYGAERSPMRVAPVSWIVRDFALVHSLVGRTEYRVLQRWRLSEGGAVRIGNGMVRS